MRYSLFILIALMFSSCFKIDCEALASGYRKEECIIIVKEMPESGIYRFYITGINPETGKDCECKSLNRWWDEYNDRISIGDTIIKRKGELTFNIHKKDTILSFNWECEGKIYK